MNSFFQLAEREIKENNNTDFDNLEFLVKSARAEINNFEERIIEEEMAKALVDAATKMPGDDNAAITAASSVGARKPEPAMSTTVHILAVDLGRAHRAAIRRLHRKMKRAMEIAEG